MTVTHVSQRPLATRLSETLGVRPGEWPVVLLLFAWCFSVVGAVWLSGAVRDTLFLAHASPAELPALYIASPLAVSLFGAVYARLAHRLRRDRLVVGTALVVAAGFALAWIFLGLGRWYFHGLYVGVEVAMSIIIVQFWGSAAEQLNSRSGKRLFGLIAAGGTTANIVLGFGVPALARWIGAEGLLLVCGGLCAAIAALATALARWATAAAPRRRPAAERSSPVTEGGAGHLKLVAAIIVLGVVTVIATDFQFKSVTAASFGNDRVAMVSFFGMISGVTGVLSLVIQLAVTSRILGSFGVVGALAALPLAMCGGSLAMVLAPGLWAATLCKGANSTLRYTLNDAGMQLLYVPAPAAARDRLKATLDAVVKPGTEAVVGLLLLGYRQLTSSLVPVAVVAAVAAAAWVVVVARLRGAYVGSLRETLRGRRLDLSGRVVIADDAAGRAGLERVRWLLGESDQRDLVARLGHAANGRQAAALLAAQAAPGIDDALRRVLADATASPRARRNAARALGLLASAPAVAALLAHVATDDETVGDAACRSLARAHGRNPALAVDRAAITGAARRELERAYRAMAAAEGLGRAETALNLDGTRAALPYRPRDADGAAALLSRTLRERWERGATRILWLLRVLHPGEALAEVQRSLGDVDAGRRANAVEVLEATVERTFRRLLVALVDDSPRHLKQATAAGRLEVPHKSRHAWVMELLADDSLWVVACAAYYAGMHLIAGATERLRALADHPRRAVREAAQLALGRIEARG